jgi:Na+-driven multidrug efflux pump
VGSQLLARPVLVLLQTPAEILPDAMTYLRVMFGAIPVILAYNLLASALRSLGDSRTPLVAMIIASFVNIALDLLFVLVFRWGIAGAAIATVLAQAVACGFCLLQILRIPQLQLQKRHFRPEGAVIKRLLLLGSPMGLSNAIIAIGGMVVQAVVNGFGVLFIAGYTATNKMFGLLEIAASSYGYGMTTYVGQNIGARRLDRIRSGMKAALGVAVVTSAVIAVTVLALGRSILSMFISGTPQEVARTMEIAYYYLAVMAVCLPLLYLIHVIRCSLQGMGNSLLPMVSGIAELVVRVTCAPLLPLVLGDVGIFYSEVLAWLGADLILIPSWIRVLRKAEHYESCMGQKVDVKLYRPMDGRKEYTGTLNGFVDGNVTVDDKVFEKKDVAQVRLHVSF